MHRFFIKTPWWVKQLFPAYVWHLPAKGKEVYLTFDDGPHPGITPWVLDELRRFDAKATFFCVGSNVAKHPAVYNRILVEGHAVGNHTHTHCNGWKTDTTQYLADVAAAADYINSNLFRPPYGRIKKAQAAGIKTALKKESAKIILWDVLSADFDQNLPPQKCLRNVLKNTEAGSVIVFHDSEKAEKNLKYTLPKVLEELHNQGCHFAAID